MGTLPNERRKRQVLDGELGSVVTRRARVWDRGPPVVPQYVLAFKFNINEIGFESDHFEV